MEPVSPEGARISHFLTRKDFKNYPSELLNYAFPGDVTRSNFNSWFIQSFAVSRGLPEAQALWMKYCSLKTGLNVSKTLLAFEGAGGLKGALSPVEVGIFAQAFEKVKIHSEQEVDIESGFDEVFDIVLDAVHKKDRFFEEMMPGWRSLDPQMFLSHIRSYVSKKWGNPHGDPDLI